MTTHDHVVKRAADPRARRLEAHLHLLLASDSPQALLIKHGPGRGSCVLGWDRSTDRVELGQCTRPDPVRARCLLTTTVRTKSATAWDLGWAMARLGVTCAIGLGTSRSLACARTWLTRAAADGDYPEAERVLAELGTRAPEPLDVSRSDLLLAPRVPKPRQ